MTKLYWATGTCALASHIALEEAGPLARRRLVRACGEPEARIALGALLDQRSGAPC